MVLSPKDRDNHSPTQLNREHDILNQWTVWILKPHTELKPLGNPFQINKCFHGDSRFMNSSDNRK